MVHPSTQSSRAGEAPRRPYVIAAVAVGIPVVALLAVPLYARRDPVVLSFPMFYWWTFVWIAVLSLAICGSHLLLEAGKPAHRAPKAAANGATRTGGEVRR